MRRIEINLRDQLDRNQPDQIKPDQVQSWQEAEVPQQNRKFHHQTRNYEFVKALFESETEAYENRTDEISLTLQNVFDFMEAAFWGQPGNGGIYHRELNANYYSLWFIRGERF